jgi:hypothetical protein
MTFSLLLRRSRPLSRQFLAPSQRLLSDEPAKRVTKVKKKIKGKKQDGVGDRNLDLILRALDAPITEPPKPDEEEARRNYEIGRNYVIGMFEQHNAHNHDLACKIKLKEFAIKMLPRDSKLKEEALKEDSSSPPLWRPIPNYTPPIPGFDPSVFANLDDD